MIKTKNLTIAAAAGFVLSFLISIFSTHNFGRSLLRGFLFGLLFGALAYGVDFLFDKFLASGNESNPLADVGTGKAPKTVGSKVDITVSDDNLTDDGDGLKFAVSNSINKEKIPAREETPAAESGIQKVSVSESEPQATFQQEVSEPVKPAASESSVSSVSESSFVPVQLGKPLNQEDAVSVSSEVPKFEAANVAAQPMDAASARKAAARAEREAGIREVGELPDIGAFIPESKGQDDEDAVIDDSDFATDGDADISFAREKNNGSSTLTSKDHDSDTMAKAIRTLLSRDN